MSNMFEVKRITPVQWEGSIVRATLDLIIKPHGIVLRDCMLKEGQYGFFVTSPSKKLKEPWVNDKGVTMEYMDIAFFPKEIRQSLEDVVTEAYNHHGGATATATSATAEMPL
jgi:DNA-binding cell septation regulator SpoVG